VLVPAIHIDFSPLADLSQKEKFGKRKTCGEEFKPALIPAPKLVPAHKF